MKDIIHKHINQANSLDEIKIALIKILEEIKRGQGIKHIWYVSGIVTSDGLEHVKKNMKILNQHTKRLQNMHNFPIFSASDIFNDLVFGKINAYELPPQDFVVFWREILQSGYITDIFMTPRWEESLGAKDEYATAQKLGLKIYYEK